MTVFDTGWQSAVRVGPRGVDALFKGGNEPILALVEKNAGLLEGDIIYTAAPGFPYGLPLGEVREPRLAADQLFKEAKVSFPYETGKLRTVLVLQSNVF